MAFAIKAPQIEKKASFFWRPNGFILVPSSSAFLNTSPYPPS